MPLLLDKTGQVDDINIPVAEHFVDGAATIVRLNLLKTLVATWFAVPASLVVNNGFAHPGRIKRFYALRITHYNRTHEL